MLYIVFYIYFWSKKIKKEKKYWVPQLKILLYKGKRSKNETDSTKQKWEKFLEFQSSENFNSNCPVRKEEEKIRSHVAANSSKNDIGKKPSNNNINMVYGRILLFGYQQPTINDNFRCFLLLCFWKKNLKEKMDFNLCELFLCNGSL